MLFQVNKPYAFISSTLTFWAPVIVMLVMYRRIYQEAMRQKEAIRRNSVPSQQHLIVDTDSNSVRSRFQTLQANGFRSKKSSKVPAVQTTAAVVAAVAKPLPPPPMIAISNSPAKNSRQQNFGKLPPPPIIMTTSDSTEDVRKIDMAGDSVPETETKFSAETATPKFRTVENSSNNCKPPPTPPPSTPSGPAPAFPGCDPAGSGDENCEANSGNSGQNSGSNSLIPTTTSGDSPTRNTLNPNTTTLLGTVQRRLSFVPGMSTNITEGRTRFLLLSLIQGAPSRFFLFMEFEFLLTSKIRISKS